MDGIVTTIVQAMTEFVGGSASAIGDGLKAILFETATGGEITGLSAPGTVLLVMIGIGFAIGLMHLVIGFIRVR